MRALRFGSFAFSAVLMGMIWACGGNSAPPETPTGPASSGSGIVGSSAPKHADPPPSDPPMKPAPKGLDAAVCTRGGKDRFGPVTLAADEAGLRRGHGDKSFADTKSSKTEPIEVCGVKGETGWLTRLTCADGSNPFGGNRGRAHASRSGSVGSGGLCGSILDLYQVPCPEGTIKVFMDMYMCGPDEGF
jgi:hypothetical protein